MPDDRPKFNDGSEHRTGYAGQQESQQATGNSMSARMEVDQQDAIEAKDSMSDGKDVVATLHFQHAKHPGLLRSKNIYRNEHFDIGRNLVQEFFDETEMDISTHHVEFHCVLFEGGGHTVTPMVYMRVISSAGRVMISHARGIGNGGLISKSHPEFLLNDSDTVHLNYEVSFSFSASADYPQAPATLPEMRLAEIEYFDDRFQVLDRVLGDGGQAKVYLAIKNGTTRQVACKIVPVPFENPEKVRAVKQKLCLDPQKQAEKLQKMASALQERREKHAREYRVLENLSHPNITKLEGVFCATNNTYICQELVSGGDLTAYLAQVGPLDKYLTAFVVKSVLEAVKYLHENDVVHRDIKPENVLLDSWRKGCRVILTDFGMSRTFQETKAQVQAEGKKSAVFRMYSVVGTSGYQAPELLKAAELEMRNRGYSKTVDIWGVGCLTATLLINDVLFHETTGDNGKAARLAMKDSQRWNLEVLQTDERWQAISNKPKSFIRHCLQVDESVRFTAKQALLHRWFTNDQHLEKAYRFSIQDWTPREEDEELIEYLDTSGILDEETQIPEETQQQPESSRSKFFESSLGPPSKLKSQFYDYSLEPPPKSSLFFKPATHNPQQAHRPLSNQRADDGGEVVKIPASPGMERRDSDVSMVGTQPAPGQGWYAFLTSDAAAHLPPLNSETNRN